MASDEEMQNVAENMAIMLEHLNDVANWLHEHIPPKELLDVWIEMAGGIINNAQNGPQPEDELKYVYMIDRSRLIARQLLIFAAGMRQGDASLCDKYGIEPGTVFVAIRERS